MTEPRVNVAFKVYRRSLRRPVQTSHGTWEAREGVLLRIEREDGQCGFGEIAPIERFGTETLAGAVAWCASLGRRVNPSRLREIPRGMPCCVAAVHAALISAEPAPADSEVQPPLRESASVAPGGVRRLSIARLLPGGEAAPEALARALDAGFTRFKLKIGISAFSVEQAAVARLVEQLPKGARMRLDANGGLDGRAAMHWLDAAAGWPVEYVEQPLPVAADRDLVRLARDHAVPIALDESVRDADDIKRWRDHGWTGVFVVKPMLAGAPDELVDEVRIAPEQFVFSSALETSIGAAAGVRLAFATGITRALGYGVGGFFEDDGMGGGWSEPVIASDELAALNPEDVWDRL